MTTWELHLTVAPVARRESHDAHDGHEALDASCAALGLKLLRIELAHARVHAAQPMATLEVGGALERALERSGDVARALAARGHDVVRTKIECDIGVVADALYVEHHVLIADDERAVAVCRAHGARLSTNARGAERFATLRHFDMDAHESEVRAHAFANGLALAGVVVRTLISERCVHDDNTPLDHSWRVP